VLSLVPSPYALDCAHEMPDPYRAPGAPNLVQDPAEVNRRDHHPDRVDRENRDDDRNANFPEHLLGFHRCANRADKR